MIRANLQAWTKGLRISERSEEFQLVVPNTPAALADNEHVLEGVDWGACLPRLYKLSPSLLRRQYCLLLRDDSVAVVSAAHSTDRYKRPSVVLVACVAAVNWNGAELVKVAHGLRALGLRQAENYSTALGGAPQHYEEQLQRGVFLQDRAFDLDLEENSDEHGLWRSLMVEVRRWKGISGVASPAFIGMGANIVSGTRHEFNRLRASGELDGFFDVARGQIVSVSHRVEPWGTAAVSAAAPTPDEDHLLEIRRQLARIADQQERGHQQSQRLMLRIADTLAAWIDGLRPGNSKRRK